MTTWAIFGGSFDPPHVGHVLALSWVLATSDVDEVLVVPALEHAFGKGLAPFPHRLKMVELALAHLRRVRVSDIEARLGGASYTVRTLEELKRRMHGLSLRLVIGSDLVAQVPSWKEGHRIAELAPLLVVGRGGYDASGRDVVIPEVSSTEIRERLKTGKSVDGLVPRAVIAHIDRYGLYREGLSC